MNAPCDAIARERQEGGRRLAIGGVALLVVGLSPLGVTAAEPGWLAPTQDGGGGRVMASGVSVDSSLGGLGGGLYLAVADGVRLQGGLPGGLNEPPVAVDQIWHRAPGLAVKQRVSRLLAGVVDAEGDALELVAFGPPLLPASLHLDNGWLVYQPPEGGGEDRFPYMVADTMEGRSVGWVHVLPQSVAPGPAQNQLGTPTALSSGGWLLRFLGIPGRSYRLEYTEDLGSPWQPLPGVPDPWVAPADGLLEAVDTEGSTPARYYRVRLSEA
ncbi:MAG: Ig-like domain-containing protein [Verrucomicrobiales bacterium]|nr:Ig-like domain-containing protein [Verrucomicrobiales bacterium]